MDDSSIGINSTSSPFKTSFPKPKSKTLWSKVTPQIKLSLTPDELKEIIEKSKDYLKLVR